MRILYVLDHPGRLAGNEIQVLALARWVAAQGWPVRFAVRRGPRPPTDLPGPWFSYGLVAAPEVPRIQGEGLRRAAAALTCAADLGLRFLTGPRDWDLVHYSGSGLITALTARLAGTPTLARISGLAGYEAGSLRLGPYRRIARLMDWLYRGVTLFQVGGEAIKQAARADGTLYIRVIPSAVDTTRFAPGRDRPARRRELGLPQDAWIAGFSGRLIASKGVDALLEAARPEGVHVLILGDGPERERLQAMAGPHVTFAGAVRDPERWLPACDAFVFPSRTEALPNAVLEAMACALPIASTGHGSTAEALGDAGILMGRGDVAEVRACLRQLRDPGDLGARARDRILERHRPEVVFPQFLELYEELAR